MHEGRRIQNPVWLQYPTDLCQHQLRAGHDMQGVGDNHCVKAVRRIGQGCGILNGEMQPTGAGLLSGLRDHSFGEIRGLPKPDGPGHPEGELPASAGQLQHIHIPGQARTHFLTDRVIELPAVLHERPVGFCHPLPKFFVVSRFHGLSLFYPAVTFCQLAASGNAPADSPPSCAQSPALLPRSNQIP